MRYNLTSNRIRCSAQRMVRILDLMTGTSNQFNHLIAMSPAAQTTTTFVVKFRSGCELWRAVEGDWFITGARPQERPYRGALYELEVADLQRKAEEGLHILEEWYPVKDKK